MKTLTKSILIVVCITLLTSAQLFGQEWSEEQKEVWAVINNLWQASADGDINKAYSILADDYKGWGAETFHAPFTKKEAKPWNERWLQKNNLVLYHLYPIAIDIHGDVAIVYYSFQNIIEKKDGKDNDEQGKWMEVYQRIDGKWLLIADVGFDFSSSSN